MVSSNPEIYAYLEEPNTKLQGLLVTSAYESTTKMDNPEKSVVFIAEQPPNTTELLLPPFKSSLILSFNLNHLNHFHSKAVRSTSSNEFQN